MAYPQDITNRFDLYGLPARRKTKEEPNDTEKDTSDLFLKPFQRDIPLLPATASRGISLNTSFPDDKPTPPATNSGLDFRNIIDERIGGRRPSFSLFDSGALSSDPGVSARNALNSAPKQQMFNWAPVAAEEEVFSRKLHGKSPIEKISMGTDNFFRSTAPDGTIVITGRGPDRIEGNAGAGGMGTQRDMIVNRLMEMIGNPKYTTGAVSGATGALNALNTAETGQQTYDIARRKLSLPVPITGFQGSEHAVDLYHPDTGTREEFFRGSLPREGDLESKDLRKLMGDMTLKEFESDLKLASDELAQPEAKKAAQERINARKAMFGQGGKGINPTWEQFLATAKRAGSKMSEAQLKAAFNERYGS